VISSPKHSFVFVPFFYLASFPSYRNHLQLDSNPEQFSGIVAVVPVISSSKQSTTVLAEFFYRD
jgi:hypothetical protein